MTTHTIAGPWLLIDGQLVPGEPPTTCTHAEAAALLGVTRSTVGTMAMRGTLERAEDGAGVVLASVLARMGRMAGRSNDS